MKLKKYLCSIEIEPLDKNQDPVTVSVTLPADSGDELTLSGVFAGYNDSPLEKLMNEYSIDAVYDFKFLSIQPTTKETNSFRNTKIYSSEYGYWITADGELYPVALYGHGTEGYRDGSIAIVTHSEHEFNFRYTSSVTKQALVALLKVVRQSQYNSYYCDCGYNEGFMYSDAMTWKDKNEVIKAIMSEIKRVEQRDLLGDM